MTNEIAKENFIILSSTEDLCAAVNGLTTILQLSGYPYAKAMGDSVYDTMQVLRTKYVKLGPSTKSRKQWIDAFKRHKDEVAKISADLISLSVITGVSNPVTNVLRSKIEFSDGLSLDEVTIKPRAFWKAYSLFAYVLYCETASQLKAVLRTITTVFSTCKDFRLSPKEKDDNIIGQIDEITTREDFPESEIDWGKELLATLETITRAVEGEKVTCSPSLNAFIATVKRARNEFKRPTLTPKVLKRTSASSGMSLKGYGTVPGNIASMFEPNLDKQWDYSKFDYISGYSYQDIPEHYLKELNLNAVRNKSVAIEQKKFDMRLIHILANQFQDRLTYLELLHKEILFRLRADATKRQEKGPIGILKWMRDFSISVINSLDLHAATNKMSLEWQRTANEYVLRWLGYDEEEIQIISETWYHIMTFDTWIVLPHSKRKVTFKFLSGQPMGFTDSFFSFATLHHIADLTVERVSGKEQVGYFLVGDDFTNAIKSDPKQEFAIRYKECMAFLNVECNLDKGYIYNSDVPDHTLKIAEFAKFLICEGQDVTPIPLGALAKFNSFGMKLTLLSWLTRHDPTIAQGLSQELVSRFCDCTDNEKLSIDLLSRIPVKNIFKSDNSPLNFGLIADFNNPAIMLAASSAWIKQSILLDTLIKVNRDENYIPKYSDITSFKNWRLRKLIRKLDDPNFEILVQYNKFYTWYTDLTLLAEAQGIVVSEVLKGLLPDQDLVDILPCINDMNENDLERIIALSEFWMSIHPDEDEFPEERQPYLQEEMKLLLSTIERVQCFEFDSLNHRFGGNQDKRVQGFDANVFIKDTLSYLSILGYTEEDLVSYSHSLREYDYQFSWNEPWESEKLDLSLIYEGEEDQSEFDPWSLV
nr:RNA-dependent RNA polymerase [Narnaviridae sp.]